ncbi:hypothetical protein [Endozoicomonas acroporae]|uniref:hypothetical protein n=1 Tax=Endozoicomonas acroporae TaxID=1701104 RepID=UPI003D79008B
MPKPTMTPLDQILVPTAKTDEVYLSRVIGQSFSFIRLKALLGLPVFIPVVIRLPGWEQRMKSAGRPQGRYCPT